MAVHLYAYGKNGLGTNDSIDYNKLLESLTIDTEQMIKSLANKYSPLPLTKKDHILQLQAHFKSISEEEYRNLLSSQNRPYVEREKYVESLFEEKQEDNVQYIKIKETEDHVWKITISPNWTSIEYEVTTLRDPMLLSIFLENDLITIRGAFDVFSVYGTFQSTISAESREFYHTLFKTILKKFQSDFILYTHEWADLLDEEEPEKTVQKLFEGFKPEMSSDSIHTMKGFYYERL